MVLVLPILHFLNKLPFEVKWLSGFSCSSLPSRMQTSLGSLQPLKKKWDSVKSWSRPIATTSVGLRIVFYTYTCRWQVLLSYKLKSLVSFGWPLLFFWPLLFNYTSFFPFCLFTSNKESLCRPAFSHTNIPNYYQHIKQKNVNCTVSVYFPCLMIQFLKENVLESVHI